ETSNSSASRTFGLDRSAVAPTARRVDGETGSPRANLDSVARLIFNSLATADNPSDLILLCNSSTFSGLATSVRCMWSSIAPGESWFKIGYLRAHLDFGGKLNPREALCPCIADPC